MNYEAILNEFNEKRILVIGDVMLDAYVLGKVTRVSPEAPVPVVALDKKENRIGGAGNVALNLKNLGASPIIATVVGTDAEGKILEDLFQKRGISSDGLVTSEFRKTTVKTRVISSKQQLLRIDSEDTHPLSSDHEKVLLEKILKLMKIGLDAIILEDYDLSLIHI